ncbi:MAG TPA: hypothetical protein VMW42_11040, partial [Desulfatiglandales bacterium]|nr:hypothetical protein [Desulfatiglandales bacterium]
MRRIGIVAVLILLLFIPLSVSSITQDFTVFKEGFSDFASSMAAELPFNTVVGLTWSDAYIGKLPHFGLGVTLGATLIPFDIFNKATQTLGVDLATEFSELANWGFPLPAATVEARVGGIYLPFDLGFKVGYLPEEAKIILPERMGLDYLLIGGDFRFALVEDKGFLPD